MVALSALKTEYHTLVDATKGVDMVTHATYGTKGKKTSINNSLW
jgi:hypothetical protein